MAFMKSAALLVATHAALVFSLGVLPETSFLRANKYARTKNLEGSIMTVGCTEKVPQNQRILLTSNAQAMHGTTALLTLLMSSDRLSTLCAGRSWQCEGYPLARDKGACTEAELNGKWDCKKHLTSEATLNMLSAYWNLKRPVLYDKEFPGADDYSALLSAESVPSMMKDNGITRLSRAHLFMWTPLCVRGLTSHSQFAPWGEKIWGASRAHFEEVRTLEILQDQHAKLVSEGVPVLVINYADLLWKTDVTVQRFLKFMPCLGQLDADFIPKMHVDMFPENEFKVEEGIRDYGQHHPATICGYDVDTYECSNQTLYDQLSPQLRNRLARAEAYFQEFSV